MRRRWLVLAAVLGPILLLAVAALVFLQNPDRYREELAQLLSEAAGYPVELAGELSLSWRPTPSITARDVRMVTPDASLQVDSVRVMVESSALLARRLRARDVTAQGVRVQLTGSALDGVLALLPDPAALPVERLEVLDVEVRRGEVSRLHLARLVLSDPDSPDGPRLSLDVPSPLLRGEARLKIAGSKLSLERIDMNTAAGRVRGHLAVATGGPRPRLTGTVTANALAVAPAPLDADLLIPRGRLDPSLLSVLDMDVTVRIGRLSLGDLRLNGVELPLLLDAGALDLRASGELAQGSIGGRLRVTTDGGPGDAPRLALELTLDDADAGSVLVMLGARGVERGGRLRVRTGLSASGADSDAILFSLAGSVAVDASDVTLRASAAALAASDLFAAVARTLRGDDDHRVQVSCAVARFDVRGGVLTTSNGIGAQSRATNIIGGGSITLADERLDLLLRPWPREGLGLSATTLVGSLGISGPIRAPTASLTSEALLRSSATAGAAAITGGLSLIAQGLMERARGDAPCAEAAGIARPSRTGPSATDRVGREVQDAARGIGRALKGLLGGDPPAGSRSGTARPDP